MLNLKPTSSAVKAYYSEIQDLSQLRLFKEGAVSPAFAALLRACARQFDWTLAEQYDLKRNGRTLRVDGALLDAFKLPHGYWEAKDTEDDLAREVKKKFDKGYPKDNILFQAPDRAILYQQGQLIIDEDISRPDALVEVLKLFFAYQPPAYEQWEQAVEEFKSKVPELAQGVLELIEKERRANRAFIAAFDDFTDLCREAINPNLSMQAVEEMLIQHLLTERIFRTVFNNPDFANRNVIAREIEKVIQALTSKSFSRADFLKSLDRFYGAIEATAATIDDFSQKQSFLNTVYEKFFQGFSVKVADTHGIVYTPPSIVDFMVRSVGEILRREFGRSLSSAGVHILDPFVGTGNFIIHIMQAMERTQLPDKYTSELHCNEVMLLPYYIAALNIEHEYLELTGSYRPFEGIALVDTFELAEGRQMPLFVRENTERVRRQQAAPIFVIIGNPPYNAGQVNENDNNKNRKYPVIDARVTETYGKASRATLLRKLNDPYIKAFRWAADRIGDEGIVAFVSNNSFITEITFDGMRKHLAQDFDAIYILDLSGNVRKNPKLSGTTHNVFGIQVGVSINLLVRKETKSPHREAKVYYARVDELWRREQKYAFLEQKEYIGNVKWKRIRPDENFNWLTEGMSEAFDTFIPMGTKAAKRGEVDAQAIFKTFSLGVATNRDEWVYGFDEDELKRKVRQIVKNYNSEVFRLSQEDKIDDIDNFVNNDPKFVKWTDRLKDTLQRQRTLKFDPNQLRRSIYRPFVKQNLYFDHLLNQRRYRQPIIFPLVDSANQLICVGGYGRKAFAVLAVDCIPDLNFYADPQQSFPFYVYNEDGSNRQENITDRALEQFRAHYKDRRISKWDIFHYVYAVLHHPQYREKYAANLKRELPRIPFAPEFKPFAKAGAKLAELHVGYEDQKEYPLKRIENKDAPLDWRVERMKLSKDKTQLFYNDFLALAGIPPATFEYRLGNRSALEWIVDQYRVTTDARSGIVSDPNQPDDPQYIVRLIGKVITVSVETVKIVKGLPALE